MFFHSHCAVGPSLRGGEWLFGNHSAADAGLGLQSKSYLHMISQVSATEDTALSRKKKSNTKPLSKRNESLKDVDTMENRNK